MSVLSKKQVVKNVNTRPVFSVIVDDLTEKIQKLADTSFSIAKKIEKLSGVDTLKLEQYNFEQQKSIPIDLSTRIQYLASIVDYLQSEVNSHLTTLVGDTDIIEQM